MYLYLLTNTVNEKKYVGITTRDVHGRWHHHVYRALCGADTALSRAIRAYGKEAFVLTVLGQADSRDELCAMERAAIVAYQTFGPLGYNMTYGGDGVVPMSEETRAAVSKRFKGMPKPVAQRQKMAEAQRGEKNHRYGKGMSDEHKAKLLTVNLGHQRGKGRQVSEKQRAHLQEQAAKRRGVTHTLEAREKIAASKRGKPRAAATKAKVSAGVLAYLETHANAMEGHVQSVDTRARISARRRAGRPAFVLDGVVYESMMAASEATGLSRHQLQYRLKRGDAAYVDKLKD